MALDLSDILVIGISSRALFDLEDSNDLFQKECLDAYRSHQLKHEQEIHTQ